jgi:hypothetical protein
MGLPLWHSGAAYNPIISTFAKLLKCRLKPTIAANTQSKMRPVSIIVKAEGPSGRAKIRSDDPKHALGLAQYLRTIGYEAWIEDSNGKGIDEKALKMAIRSRHKDAPSV